MHAGQRVLNATQRWNVALIVFAVLCLFVPTYWTLYQTVWQTPEQNQGGLVLLIVLFLIWQKRDQLTSLLAQLPNAGLFPSLPMWQLFLSWGGLLIGLMFYVIGRSQDILLFEVGSQMIILASLLCLIAGSKALFILLFPLLFLFFMWPLPSSIVDALTLPMKIAVSNVAEWVLYHLGFPIARDGVVLQIGYYRLLVADACAGLHTLFSLEAMGMLYLYLVRRTSWFRNVLLALLILPISFLANTIRVMTLVLITYYWGDAVGQGFIHGFAGFFLFLVALILIVFVDRLLQFLERVFAKESG